MGRPAWFRRRLRTLGEQYLLAVPSNTLIRDLESPLPEYRGRGRRPNRPWQGVSQWREALEPEAWRRIDVCDGSKGPLVVEVVKRRVATRTHRRQQDEAEMLVVVRYGDRDEHRVVKVDDYLSNAAAETSLLEFARVAKAGHKAAIQGTVHDPGGPGGFPHPSSRVASALDPFGISSRYTPPTEAWTQEGPRLCGPIMPQAAGIPSVRRMVKSEGGSTTLSVVHTLSEPIRIT